MKIIIDEAKSLSYEDIENISKIIKLPSISVTKKDSISIMKLMKEGEK